MTDNSTDPLRLIPVTSVAGPHLAGIRRGSLHLPAHGLRRLSHQQPSRKPVVPGQGEKHLVARFGHNPAAMYNGNARR